MYKTMTVKDLKDVLNKLDSGHDDMFIILPSDDEGNSFRTIGNTFTPAYTDGEGDYLDIDFETEQINCIVIG